MISLACSCSQRYLWLVYTSPSGNVLRRRLRPFSAALRFVGCSVGEKPCRSIFFVCLYILATLPHNMKVVDRETVYESDINTGMDGVSAHVTRVDVTCISDKESGFGLLGEQYTFRESTHEITDRSDETLQIAGRGSTSRRCYVWLNLLERADGTLPIVDQSGLIPVEVATMGRPEIAGYLFAVHGSDLNELSEIIEVTPQTVKQYMVDLDRGRRGKL
jgi:hypothetical protein